MSKGSFTSQTSWHEGDQLCWRRSFTGNSRSVVGGTWQNADVWLVGSRHNADTGHNADYLKPLQA